MTASLFRVGTALAHLEVLNNTALQYRQEVERLQEDVAKLQQVLLIGCNQQASPPCKHKKTDPLTLDSTYITLLTPTMHKLPLKQIDLWAINK